MKKGFDIHKAAALASIVLVMLAAVVPWLSMQATAWEKLEGQLSEVRGDINNVSDAIRYLVLENGDWDTYDYDGLVANSMAQLDRGADSFACAYRGMEFENISAKYPEFWEPSFDPMTSPDFTADALAKFGQTGIHQYDVWHDPPGGIGGGRMMYIQYRWVPVVEGIADPYLLVIGMSKYTAASETSTPFYVAWLVLVMAAIVNLFLRMQSQAASKIEQSEFYMKQAELRGSVGRTEFIRAIKEELKEELKNDG